MTRSWGSSAGVVAVVLILMTNRAAAQLMSTCVADSPERRGEIGCSSFRASRFRRAHAAIARLPLSSSERQTMAP
jgi:hypothetical protein